MKKRFVFGLFLVALVLLSCAPQNDSVGQASQLRNPDGQTSSSPRPLRVGETVYLKQYVPNPDRNEYDPSREMWVPYIVTRRYELSGDPMVLSVDFDAVQQLAFPGIIDRVPNEISAQTLAQASSDFKSRLYGADQRTVIAIDSSNVAEFKISSNTPPSIPASTPAPGSPPAQDTGDPGGPGGGPAAPPDETSVVTSVTPLVTVSNQFKSFVEARNKQTSNQYSPLIKEEKGNQLLLNNGRSIIKLSDDLYFDQSTSSFYDKDGREISGHVNYELRDSDGKLVRGSPVYALTSQSDRAVIYEYVRFTQDSDNLKIENPRDQWAVIEHGTDIIIVGGQLPPKTDGQSSAEYTTLFLDTLDESKVLVRGSRNSPLHNVDWSNSNNIREIGKNNGEFTMLDSDVFLNFQKKLGEPNSIYTVTTTSKGTTDKTTDFYHFLDGRDVKLKSVVTTSNSNQGLVERRVETAYSYDTISNVNFQTGTVINEQRTYKIGTDKEFVKTTPAGFLIFDNDVKMSSNQLSSTIPNSFLSSPQAVDVDWKNARNSLRVPRDPTPRQQSVKLLDQDWASLPTTSGSRVLVTGTDDNLRIIEARQRTTAGGGSQFNYISGSDYSKTLINGQTRIERRSYELDDDAQMKPDTVTGFVYYRQDDREIVIQHENNQYAIHDGDNAYSLPSTVYDGYQTLLAPGGTKTIQDAQAIAYVSSRFTPDKISATFSQENGAQFHHQNGELIEYDRANGIIKHTLADGITTDYTHLTSDSVKLTVSYPDAGQGHVPFTQEIIFNINPIDNPRYTITRDNNQQQVDLYNSGGYITNRFVGTLTSTQSIIFNKNDATSGMIKSADVPSLSFDDKNYYYTDDKNKIHKFNNEGHLLVQNSDATTSVITDPEEIKRQLGFAQNTDSKVRINGVADIKHSIELANDARSEVRNKNSEHTSALEAVTQRNTRIDAALSDFFSFQDLPLDVNGNPILAEREEADGDSSHAAALTPKAEDGTASGTSSTGTSGKFFLSPSTPPAPPSTPPAPKLDIVYIVDGKLFVQDSNIFGSGREVTTVDLQQLAKDDIIKYDEKTGEVEFGDQTFVKKKGKDGKETYARELGFGYDIDGPGEYFDSLFSNYRPQQALSSLLLNDAFKSDWIETTDKAFADGYLGIDHWTSDICRKEFDVIGEDVGVIEAAPGLFQLIAHSEGEISEALPMLCDEEDKCLKGTCRLLDKQCVDDNGDTNPRNDVVHKEYVYKITVGVTAPADEDLTPNRDEEGAVSFNIAVKGKDRSGVIFANPVQLKNGKSFQQVFIERKSDAYDEVCIVFNKKPKSYDGRDVNRVCNDIVHAQMKFITRPESRAAAGEALPCSGAACW